MVYDSTRPPAVPVPARIMWRCRRGMREMDILCTRFVEGVYGELTELERGALERLLECPDQDILGWLTGGTDPEDRELAALMLRMRAMTGTPSLT
jgi:antitoxin CptB